MVGWILGFCHPQHHHLNSLLPLVRKSCWIRPCRYIKAILFSMLLTHSRFQDFFESRVLLNATLAYFLDCFDRSGFWIRRRRKWSMRSYFTSCFHCWSLLLFWLSLQECDEKWKKEALVFRWSGYYIIIRKQWIKLLIFFLRQLWPHSHWWWCQSCHEMIYHAHHDFQSFLNYRLHWVQHWRSRSDGIS